MTALNLGIYNVAPFWNKINKHLGDSCFTFTLVKLVWGPKLQNFENYPWFHEFSHVGVCSQQFSAKIHLWICLTFSNSDKWLSFESQLGSLHLSDLQLPRRPRRGYSAWRGRCLKKPACPFWTARILIVFVITMWNMRIFQEVGRLLGTHLEHDRILSPSAWHRSDSCQSS